VVAVAVAAAALAGAGVLWWMHRPQVRRQAGLNVLIITIDTLRADSVGCYGEGGRDTPWMDALAAAGVRFHRAHAHNVVTLPSHANILSGLYPSQHGVRDNAGFRFPAGRETLATILKRAGYRTGAFVSAFPLDSRFGLDRGFDVYDDRLGGAEIRSGFQVPERSGAETVEAARRWLAAQGEARVFCFVHLYEPHFPYQPPEPFASRFPTNPYRGEVAAADAALAPLLKPLLDAGPRGRTLVVLTGDHGESLGEHGEMTHGIFAYESTLRVPLVFFAPEILKPRVVATPVRHVDVLPTVLDALGLEPPAHLPGRSLLDVAARDEGAAEDSYFEALSPSLNQGWAPLRGILHDGLKYVELPIPELYNLTRDAAESKNLAASRPVELESMRALLSGLRRDELPVTRGEEEASARERLRALGYLAASGPSPTKERYTEQDDPKQLIDIDRRQSDALGRYYAGDLGGAIALCRENIKRRPDMPMAYLHLASFERARGDLGAAVNALRQAVALRPLDMESVALLGVYLNEGGRSREAAELLEPYTKAPRPDLDVLTARGVALATLGRNEEALAAFAAAREVDPSNAMVVVNVATVHLMAGELDRARRMFEDALRIDPGLARAHNSLGVIAAREGRLDGAIEHWKRAAALDPNDYQTLFNLGSTLRRLGRDDEARPYLQAYVREAPAAEETRDLARVRSWLGERGQGGAGR